MTPPPPIIVAKTVKDSILPRETLGEGAGDDHAEAEWREPSNEGTPQDGAGLQDTEVTNDSRALVTA